MAQEIVDFLTYEQPQGVKRCPTCGIEYTDARSFCPICGADIASVLAMREKAGEYDEEEYIRKDTPESVKDGKLVRAIKIAGISVAVIAGVLLVAIISVVFGFFL